MAAPCSLWRDADWGKMYKQWRDRNRLGAEPLKKPPLPDFLLRSHSFVHSLDIPALADIYKEPTTVGSLKSQR